MLVQRLNAILREEIAGYCLKQISETKPEFTCPEHKVNPYVIMVVGVNGVGKTTTIGKLAQSV